MPTILALVTIASGTATATSGAVLWTTSEPGQTITLPDPGALPAATAITIIADGGTDSGDVVAPGVGALVALAPGSIATLVRTGGGAWGVQYPPAP